jgi:hypothetical protein
MPSIKHLDVVPEPNIIMDSLVVVLLFAPRSVAGSMGAAKEAALRKEILTHFVMGQLQLRLDSLRKL